MASIIFRGDYHQPILLLPIGEKQRKSEEAYGPLTHTHIIFYVWSGVVATANTREVIYKFGVRRFDWADTKTYTVSELMQSVINRQLDYCRWHSIIAHDVNIELISAPIPFSGNWGNSALGQLEYRLKRPENNPLLLQHSITDECKLTNTNSTELMCDNRFKQLYVVPFIKNYANIIQSDPPIAFIDLDNDESEVFYVPTQ